MSSTWSARFRLNYQAPGDNLNTWGLLLNGQVFQPLEDAIAGRLALPLSGPVTLTTANGTTDQARMAWLDLTGSGGTVTIPSVEKLYDVLNGCTGPAVFTTGGATNAAVPAGARARIACDGSTVRIITGSEFGGLTLTGVGAPVTDTDGTNKRWVLDQISGTIAAGFPDQASAVAQFITTDGAHLAWGNPLPSQPGNARKALFTSGTDRTGAGWDWAGITVWRALYADLTAVLDSDNNNAILLFASLTLYLPHLTDKAGRFSVLIHNVSGSTCYITPIGGDNVKGASICPMPPGEARLFIGSPGGQWEAIILQPYDVILTSSQAFQVGPGYSRHVGELWAGGAGGNRQGAGVAANGGGGGACVPFNISDAAFGPSPTITIGAGGIGGTTGSTTATAGGTSSVGGVVAAYGGGADASGNGAGGGGAFGPGLAAAGGRGGVFGGGAPNSDATKDGGYGGGAGATATYGGGVALYGGGGGGAPGQGAGASVFGGSGGAAGAAGAAPGGGGGGASGADGGAGARGECRLRGVV